MENADRFFVDAHLHLQDERLDPYREKIIDDLRAAGISRWVVNGTCEDDWEAVAQLAEKYPEVIPCFGLHPWKIKDRSEQWRERLCNYLERFPEAGIGEIGLDKWIRDHDLEDQELVLRDQLEFAVEYDRPTMVHCLRCFGTLRDLFVDFRNASGFPEEFHFLLHSYGGPKEMVEEFARLGAWFSFSGYFMEERKADTREAFAAVPLDRLLIETDAPDMPLPADLEAISLTTEEEGMRLNHPANLPIIYREVAKLRKLDNTSLMRQVAINFSRFNTGHGG
jgi:TatD DNase family protein